MQKSRARTQLYMLIKPISLYLKRRLLKHKILTESLYFCLTSLNDNVCVLIIFFILLTL